MPRAWASCGRSRCSTSRASASSRWRPSPGPVSSSSASSRTMSARASASGSPTARAASSASLARARASRLCSWPSRISAANEDSRARMRAASGLSSCSTNRLATLSSRRAAENASRPLSGARPLQEQLGARQRVVAQQGGRPAVRVEGRVEHPGQLPHVAEQRQDPHPFTGRELREPAGRVERLLVERRGIGVGVGGAGPIGGETGVAPRPFRVADHARSAARVRPRPPRRGPVRSPPQRPGAAGCGPGTAARRRRRPG